MVTRSRIRVCEAGSYENSAAMPSTLVAVGSEVEHHSSIFRNTHLKVSCSIHGDSPTLGLPHSTVLMQMETFKGSRLAAHIKPRPPLHCSGIVGRRHRPLIIEMVASEWSIARGLESKGLCGELDATSHHAAGCIPDSAGRSCPYIQRHFHPSK